MHRGQRRAAAVLTLALSWIAADAAELKLLLPLARTAYQTNETIDLAVVQGTQSRLFFREAGSEFKLRGTTNLSIATMTALDRDLLVFFDDGAAYRYDPDPDPPAAESILPGRKIFPEFVQRVLGCTLGIPIARPPFRKPPGCSG